MNFTKHPKTVEAGLLSIGGLLLITGGSMLQSNWPVALGMLVASTAVYMLNYAVLKR